MTYKLFFSRLYVYLKPHIGKIIITLLSVIIASLLTSTLPEITGRIVDNLFTENSKSDESALLYATILLMVSLLMNLFTLIHTASNSWVSNQIIATIRQTMFAKLLNLPQSYFDQNTTGQTLSKLTFDVEQISTAASTIWVDFARASVMVIALLSYLIYKNWLLSLLLIVLIPIIVITIKISAIRMRKASQTVQQSMGEMTHQLDENISGSSLIKLYHAQTQEQSKFLSLSTRIRQQRFKVDMANGLNASVASLGIGVALSLVVYFSSTYLTMSAGEFLSFFTAMTILVKPVKQLININKPLQLALAAAKSVFDLIDTPSEPNEQTSRLEQVKGRIEFKNVDFTYNQTKTVLNQLNLTIEAGQTIALVGTTGSGKSTIIQLLCRLYQPSSGTIEVDGIDIAQLDLACFRQHIALVDQSIGLFNGTIAQNIALGQDDMPFSIIKESADIACATEFINQLDNKFETLIGQNGVLLSGGQRQRLAIARAIAKNSPILILDEATSALDNQTQQQLQQSIDYIHGKKTLIIIAHRLNTVQKADKIIVLNKGQIAEQGTHQSLLNKLGIYSQLYNQFE